MTHFITPDGHIFVTDGVPAQKYLDQYPEGTVEIADPPSDDHRWVDGEWVLIGPTPTEIRVQTSAAVNAERDRRMGSTFFYNGSIFDCDPSSLARITGAATLAGFAMGAGAVAGNLRWHGGATDFAWIDAANNVVAMDAPTTFGFGQAAATNEAAHIFDAKALKDMAVLPGDYIDDGYWP